MSCSAGDGPFDQDDDYKGRLAEPEPMLFASSPAYLTYLQRIADEDVQGLKKAQESYGDSWKKRGGVGAFMMLARKWDRLENALKPGDGKTGPTHQCASLAPPWDIFAATIADGRAEGLIDDIRDLRRYLLLVEGELRAKGLELKHRDNE